MSTIKRKADNDAVVFNTGDTMSGPLSFTGTDHEGVRLISLTTAQRDALTPANGMVIYNSDDNSMQARVGGAWLDVTVGGVLSDYLPLSGGTMTGNINLGNLTASRVIQTDGSKNIATSSVTSTELSYLSGVTSAIQTQFSTVSTSLAITAWDSYSLGVVAPTATGDGAVATSSSGATTTASGDRSFALQGGRSTGHDSYAFKGLASAQSSIAIGTQNTESSAVGAVAIGDQAKSNTVCGFAFGGGEYDTNGDCQENLFILRAITTDATQTEALAGSSGSPSSRISMQTSSAMTFSALIVAKRTDATTEAAAYKIEGGIRKDTTAGSTALIGSITKTVLGEDTAAWDVTAEADTTNGTLVFKVTGEASKTIKWTVTCRAAQVTHV